MEPVVDAAVVDAEPMLLLGAADVLAGPLSLLVVVTGLLVERLVEVLVLFAIELPHSTTAPVVAAVITLPEGVAVPTVA